MFGAVMFTIMNVRTNSSFYFYFKFDFFFHKNSCLQIGYLPIVVYVPALAFNQGKIYLLFVPLLHLKKSNQRFEVACVNRFSDWSKYSYYNADCLHYMRILYMRRKLFSHHVNK